MVTRSQAKSMDDQPPTSDTHDRPAAEARQTGKQGMRGKKVSDPTLVPRLMACGFPMALGMLGPIFVISGLMMIQEGVKRPPNPIPVMTLYNFAFKKAGLLFPFLLMFIRIICSYAIGTSPFEGPILRTLPIMFVVVSAVRAGVYGLTLMMPHESMSDHVFLGLSIAALARLELFASLDTLRQSSSKLRKVLWLPAISSVVLVLLTHGNNYVTARYFHSTGETAMSLGAGLGMFEAPVSFFLWRSLRRRIGGSAC